ncbi:helix-turn-helix transcriptional regulator [Natronospora cellulosivora (SeqCode)]
MRVYRLLAIIMILVNKKKVSATELADKLEVSPRTIYRDIESICQAGIPVVSYQGIDGGFSIMDNYKMDKTLFTNEEILAIIAALDGLNSSINSSSFKFISEKIKNLFPEDEFKESRQELILDLNPWGYNEDIKDKLELIQNAIKKKRIIKINYINAKHQIRERNIEAITLVLKSTSWYLFAYCQLKKDYRIFRLSRITKLEILNEEYDNTHPCFKEYKKDNTWKNPAKKVTMKLLFKKDALLHIQDFFSKEQIEKQEDGSFLVTVTFPEDNWVYGFVLSFGDMVKVLSPPHIKDIIKEKARNIYLQYK